MSLGANINKHLRRSFAAREDSQLKNDPISSFGSEKQNGPPCKDNNKKKKPTRFSFVFFFFISTGKKKEKEQQQQELQATSDIMYATMMSTPDPIESSSLGR